MAAIVRHDPDVCQETPPGFAAGRASEPAPGGAGGAGVASAAPASGQGPGLVLSAISRRVSNCGVRRG